MSAPGRRSELQSFNPSFPALCRYTVKTQVTSDQPYQYEKSVWCWSWKLKCTRTKMAVRRVTKDVDIEKSRLVFECCSGYRRQGNRCAPVCETSCVHGECVAPDTCKCDEHYGGPDCSACK